MFSIPMAQLRISFVCLSVLFLGAMMLVTAGTIQAAVDLIILIPDSVDHRSFPKTPGHQGISQAKFDGAWSFPGLEGWLKVGGYVKGDYIQDFDFIGNEGSFVTSTIPTSETNLGGRATLQARQSRINLDSRFDSNIGVVRAYMEMDFFGAGNSLRLRHAYAEWGGFLAGQTWTNFMDGQAQPTTLDFEGPDSMLTHRQAQLRYTGHAGNHWQWSLSVEDPRSQFSSAHTVDAIDRSQVPDAPGYIQISPDWGHLRLSGISRQLRFVSADGTIDQSAFGWGINFSGITKLGARDHFLAQFAFGDGVSHYIQGFSGTGSDAFLTAAGNLETITAKSALLGFSHSWNDSWDSTLSMGTSKLENNPEQADSSIESLVHSHFNLLWKPNAHFTMGGEVMWGKREDKNGMKGEATRFIFSCYTKF